ncbi:MAG: enoyl-CoA hydratase/isomerase family protein [Melioribacteraceae bacterium]|nr:enoyl-CoA hydratase/isomerase family protein [Melioribacteraceae bacterium]MCO6472326.1 enoyl-CoA hydratase/isomerase family protein [Melioribacteraceae bacterium]MDD3559762.1 enoyl-CoA hydratase/isomerase family protein [Melioribacteraceae bacterium]
MEYGKIESVTKDKICTITFSHPKSNSLPGDLLRDLAKQITLCGESDENNVIVIKSEGEKAFCAGASFDELLDINDFETGKNFFMGFALVINSIRKSPKFIITKVQGKTVGGGVGLVAASDYALALKNASVKLSELALGIGPFVVGPAVERKIGKAAFTEMSVDFDWRTAAWANQRGLFTEVYNTINELEDGVEVIASKLASSSPEAMKELKRVLWEGTENWDELLEARAEISGKLVLSDFTKEYIKQFKNK